MHITLLVMCTLMNSRGDRFIATRREEDDMHLTPFGDLGESMGIRRSNFSNMFFDSNPTSLYNMLYSRSPSVCKHTVHMNSAFVLDAPNINNYRAACQHIR